MLDWQADSVLPQRVLQYLGAAKIHIQRTTFILSMFNTAGIALTTYYAAGVPTWTIPTTTIRPFTSVLAWLGVIMAGALAFLVVDRTVLYPAEVSYNSHQASERERNPGYDVTVDSNERLRRIEAELGIAAADGGEDEQEGDG